MATKAPEKLLGVAELVALTGFTKQTVTLMLNKEWKVPGGTKFIRGEYRLPLSFYNRWVDAQDVALKEKETSDV